MSDDQCRNLVSAVRELLETLFIFPVNTEELVYAWVRDRNGFKQLPVSDHDAERVIAIKEMAEGAALEGDGE